MSKIRVLIADDHPLIIEGLTTALTRHGIQVVGQAIATGEVLAQYAQSKADVVVLDVRFGEAMTGLDVAQDLIARHPQARIVFYSQFDKNEIIREAYRIGGKGFITKNTPTETLAEAIEQVQQGKTHFLPNIAERLALMGVRRDDSPRNKLEPRELDVFVRMAQGRTNHEIAEAMSLSPKTISVVSQNI